MNKSNYAELTEKEKDEMIEVLTEELPVLRAKIAMSQETLSNLIGVSRQTYSSIETRKRKMTWNTYLSLLFVFSNNERTAPMLESCGAFPDSLKNEINVYNRNNEMVLK